MTSGRADVAPIPTTRYIDAATQSSTQRWVFDLQACQTAGSAHRGVGRYSSSLFNALVAGCCRVDFRGVVSATLPHPVVPQPLRAEHIITVPQLPDGLTPRKADGGPQDDLDGILLSNRLAPLKADLIHVSHVFEGFSDRVALPSHSFKAPGQIVSATLYDLIPLLFREHYFQSPEFARWYYARIDWLRKADLLLAISESSRKDASEWLGIDPARIVTIHGGIGPQFVPAPNVSGLRDELRSRYGFRSRYVLYTGGDDHRKNIAGAIRSYALLPGELRRQCQLVIVCSMEPSRKAMYAEIGRQAGLADSDVLITGFVPEADLVAFYQCCDAFIFPSLYEGLGLPVLEAMACGAPTIGGDNSSIRELVGRADALFDSRSDAATARALSKVLTDASFARNLTDYGLKRARVFNWERTAALAREALADAVLRAQGGGVAAAVSGWLPKPRLAMVTPLPPCRSGIADYNAKFVPFLARHFDIDLVVDHYQVVDASLTSAFAVLDISQFEKVAHLYDAILYEFGNSEFHSHMLPLLKRYPGVVGLHDAYLSGLYGYLDFQLGDTGSYPKTMIAVHGSRARRYYAPVMHHPEPNGGTMVELPCTKPVLDGALGVISHSPFNLEMARLNFPEGWQAPYRIIPQMVQLPPLQTTARLAAWRAQLGFPQAAVVVATFGHVAWTKWGDLLLDAFLASPLGERGDAYLIYVGELAQDAFGSRLNDSIQAAGLGKRIRITGFLEEEDYNRYLHVADIAVQLRTKSRGGTPKGVLDCLTRGIPVVVNDDASYRDYPADVVFKLPAVPSVDDIAQALTALGGSVEQRRLLGERARDYVGEQHDPQRCAALYAAAIREMMARARLNDASAAVDALAPLAARIADPATGLPEVAAFVEARSQPSFAKRRVFIDVSFIAVHDHESGIQRVVKKIVHHFYTMDIAGVEAVAVVLTAGRLHVATAWLSSKGLLHPHELDSAMPDRDLSFRPGDVLLMLDSSWARYREFGPIHARARSAGATIVVAVYDLLPLQMPPSFIVEGGPAWFKDWVLNGAVNCSDAIITISKAVAFDMQEFIDTEPGVQRRPHVGFWHLGSDIPTGVGAAPASNASSRIGSRPFLLMVGTIEPRKMHDIALSAFEQLWAGGLELGLCIAGKHGWLREDVMKRLRKHEEQGRRLHLFEHPSDADISDLYAHAAGLLLLSKGEGFGLPLVEAANHGVPILCSDLPVFKEICGDWATYLSGDEPPAVASGISAWWDARRRGEVKATHEMPRFTWEQSARNLMDVILNERWIDQERRGC